MLRALHKSKLPIWHTEGFNPHPFVTFPLPLSLGFRGTNECMDVKLEDDDYSYEEIITKLNNCLPKGLRVFNVTEPVMKAGEIAYADFTLKISYDKISSDKICSHLKDLFALKKIEIEKKSKKGIKIIDIKPGIKSYEVAENSGFAELNIILSAGSIDNINPNLIISALEKYFSESYYVDITRNKLYNSDMELFR